MDRSGQSHALTPLLPGKSLSLPTEQEAVWGPELAWMARKTEESFDLAGNQMSFQRCSTHSLVTVPTEIFYLPCHCAWHSAKADSSFRTVLIVTLFKKSYQPHN